MAREIKLRAWNGYKMIDKFFISSNGQPFLDSDPKGVDMSNTTRIYPPNYNYYKIMQSTGLKDCTGKEIYEGDVVEYLTNSGPEKSFVFWLDDLGAWGLMPTGHKINKGEILFTIGHDVLEVIGNIYSNPELVK